MTWWYKFGAKYILGRLPTSYDLNQQPGFFHRGYTDGASYALNIFDSHVKREELQSQLYDNTILELGLGDSVASSIIV